LIQSLLASLDDRTPSVANQACHALYNLAHACEDESSETTTNKLSHYVPALLQKLMNVVNRDDGDEVNLRASAYEAVNMIVQSSADDSQNLIVHVLSEVCVRLDRSFAAGLDQQDRMSLQSQLCSLIGHCVLKLPVNFIAPQSNKLMEILLKVFTNNGAVAHEDAFLSIGYIIDKLENDFGKLGYVAHLMPFILQVQILF
jgi:importin subunit beta-1